MKWIAILVSLVAPALAQVQVGPTDIGGAVASSKGPEAGVWVIAETADLPTKYAKIVVTDDRGRYLLPGSSQGQLQRLGARLRAGGFGQGDRRAGQDTEPHGGAGAQPARRRGLLSGQLLVLAAAARPPRANSPAPGRDGNGITAT